MKVLALFMVMLIALASCNTQRLLSKQNLATPTPHQILELVEGLLEGAFGEEGEAAAHCLENGEKIFYLFEEAIDELKAGGVDSIIQGFVHLGTALQALVTEFEDCEKALKIVTDIEIIAAKFLEPQALAIEVGTSIIWHGFHIYNDVKKTIKNFEAENYQEAGKNFGDIINVVFGGSFMMYSPTQDSIDTVEGILVGAFGDDGKEVVVCVNDGEAIFTDIEAAIKEFQKGGVTNIVSGLYHIGEALEEFPQELKDCEQAEAILADIGLIAAEFKNPKGLVIHVGEEVLWHGMDIYKDITGATSDFEDGQYEPAGEAIGDIVKLLLVESVTKMIKTSF
jgi:hypothetical protein